MQENVFSPGPMTRNRRKSVSSAIKQTAVDVDAALLMQHAQQLSRRLSPEPQEPQEMASLIDSQPAAAPSFTITSKITYPLFLVGTLLALAVILALLISIFGMGASPKVHAEVGSFGVAGLDPASVDHGASHASSSELDTVSQLEAQIQKLEVCERGEKVGERRAGREGRADQSA